MTWNLANFAWVSFRFNEISTGVIKVPLGYPQASMALGTLILTIALLDELVVVLTRGRPTFRACRRSHHPGQRGLRP